MRILFVCSYYKPGHVYGGPARSISFLCEGMVKAEARVTVFTNDVNDLGNSLKVPMDRALDVEGGKSTILSCVAGPDQSNTFISVMPRQIPLRNFQVDWPRPHRESLIQASTSDIGGVILADSD
jgi:hypothetical protein